MSSQPMRDRYRVNYQGDHARLVARFSTNGGCVVSRKRRKLQLLRQQGRRMHEAFSGAGKDRGIEETERDGAADRAIGVLSGARGFGGVSRALWPVQLRQSAAVGRGAQRRRLMKRVWWAIELYSARVRLLYVWITVALLIMGLFLVLFVLRQRHAFLITVMLIIVIVSHIVFSNLFRLARSGIALHHNRQQHAGVTSEKRMLRAIKIVRLLHIVSAEWFRRAQRARDLPHAARVPRTTYLSGPVRALRTAHVPITQRLVSVQQTQKLQGATSARMSRIPMALRSPETPMPVAPLVRVLETIDLSTCDVEHFLDTLDTVPELEAFPPLKANEHFTDEYLI